jgi:hypothetical protein
MASAPLLAEPQAGTIKYTGKEENRTKISAHWFPTLPKNTLIHSLSFHRPIARARTPTTPAMLATIAPVGAGAPAVDVDVDPAVADAVADSSRELTEDLIEL